MALIELPVGLALTAGSVAAFNPCGFAMLPAYLGFFVREDDPADGTRSNAVARALVVSAAMTFGFMLVFATFGLLIDGASIAAGDITPWLTVGIGAAMVPIGILLLLGRSIKVRLPRLQRGGGDRRFGEHVPVRHVVCHRVVVVHASGVPHRGLGLVPLRRVRERTRLLRGVRDRHGAGHHHAHRGDRVGTRWGRSRVRNALPYFNRVAGALLVVAGMYVAYYGYWEIRVLAGRDVPEGPVAWVSIWSARTTQRVDDLGVVVLACALGSVLAFVGALHLRRRRSVAAPLPSEIAEPLAWHANLAHDAPTTKATP